ncbi:aminopeptidase [Clostridium chromiireducens]|uniref:Aminopeptidase n=1 Tax=Clostridium chromiireducens TaxID=225345 RepID=A0A1V4IYC3_9CLOT|nr:aminopeptidase [Clostridium chromiireducens]OPJ64764.1 aminopeptidase 2 [Clostridium chromiireducens]RII35937.1 aminopeptidase [Clostridium chromiireducens]
MNIDILKNYAELIVKTGINLQDKQQLLINSPIECAEFARIIAEKAYEAGAINVIVEYNDEELALIKYNKAPIESFEKEPTYVALSREELIREKTAFISISARDPELLSGVDPNKISTLAKTTSKTMRKVSSSMMSNEVQWCVVSIPTKGWAKKVFPDVSEAEAVEKLWNSIFSIVRVDKESPVSEWNEHLENLKKRKDYLNEKNFKYLHYKSEGTDLTVELPEGHLWLSGEESTKDGITFVANIPTEEVFTLPKKDGVNGYVTSKKPLNYGGNVIDNFKLTFKDGKIIDFNAEKGEEILKGLLDTDEGARYLGEVALVGHDSPISNSGLIFFNTLFDENASCHFAFGKAYPSCLKDSDNMSEEELLSKGVNDSLTHVDFMIGSAELEIIGETIGGDKIQVFKNGDWVI